MAKFEDTEPLANGAELPSHPANTTSLKVVKYGKVWDCENGRELQHGLHGNEIQCLMLGQQMALDHLYRYVIRDKRIFHTRKAVTIDVECEPVEHN